MTYRVAVTYAAGNTNVHDNLTEQQVFDAIHAFSHDMLMLRGNGVASFTVEDETMPPDQLAALRFTSAFPDGPVRVEGKVIPPPATETT